MVELRSYSTLGHRPAATIVAGRGPDPIGALEVAELQNNARTLDQGGVALAVIVSVDGWDGPPFQGDLSWFDQLTEDVHLLAEWAIPLCLSMADQLRRPRPAHLKGSGYIATNLLGVVNCQGCLEWARA